jgi:NitT/TauT family transport system substrate-binding protein
MRGAARQENPSQRIKEGEDNKMRRSTLIVFFTLSTACLGTAAWGQETVKIGVNGVVSDAAFFIAQKKGYFAKQGITAELVHFDSGPQMVAPLGTGQIDVAAGASSAGLFNAVARGIGLKVVADKGSAPVGYSYVPIIVRKDLIDEGKVKTYADFKGLKVAEAGKGGTPGPILNEGLKRGGLAYDDVQHVYNLGYAQQVLALANKAIDVGVTAEPSATQAVNQGYAVRFSAPDHYPNQQIAVLLYGDLFIKSRSDVATKFMVAYLEGVRFYNGALKDGHFSGPNAPELIDILVEFTKVKDRSLYADMTPNGCNPDGHVDMPSLTEDFEFYKAHGYLEGTTTVDVLVDKTFVDRALKILGPYKPKS